MKELFSILLLILTSIVAVAQAWSGATPGNIYYNSGKVGIGTNNPGATLDVNKVLPATTTPDYNTSQVVISSSFISGQNNRSTLYFFPFNLTGNSSPAAISAIAAPNTQSSLAFYTNPNLNYSTIPLERMRISSEGNIGVGTASPNGKLHIAGRNAIPTKVRIAGNNSQGNWFSYFGSDGSNPDFSTKLRVLEENISGLNNGIAISAEQNNGTPRYALGTKDNTPIALFTNGTEILRFTSNGNVGIGTTSPQAKLDIVNGNAQMQFAVGSTNGSGLGDMLRVFGVNGMSLSVNSYVPATGNLITDLGVNYSVDGGNGVTPYARIGSKKSPVLRLSAEDGSVGLYGESGSGADFRTPTLNLGVYVHNSGNVGIGTSSPQSKLTVAGEIQSRKVKVTINAGADFVFDEDYTLRKLEELQKYIQQHKHLPNIPSAKEMETKGIELGEMNIKLLQKIEELTLYVIEQNKKLEQQSQELKRLNEIVKKGLPAFCTE